MVERWHQETHTFHLRVREVTITLQDIAVLFGLWVHGPAIIDTAHIIWSNLYEKLFGIRPLEAILSGSSLRFHWLHDTFHHLSDDADNETMQRHARAFILCLISGHLFIDKFGSHVQLLYLPQLRALHICGQMSLDSTILSFLYHELCRTTRPDAHEIAGPLVLLQLWIWEHLHIGRSDRVLPRVRAHQPTVGGDIVGHGPLDEDDAGFEGLFDGI
ncbi:serine/threonine-protein phosphatase 7 long form homolog [Elaeis guineensis]|uniref:serine/threonine-protein phosphatase 7 long form homolog n=1 Tax=Elaeis guineensis var. tenera TaxID=51953 RepID=UPI003C6D326C